MGAGGSSAKAERGIENSMSLPKIALTNGLSHGILMLESSAALRKEVMTRWSKLAGSSGLEVGI